MGNNPSYNNFKTLLLQSPEGILSSELIEIIKNWDIQPTSFQLMNAINHIRQYSSAHPIVIQVLEHQYDAQLVQEQLTINKG